MNVGNTVSSTIPIVLEGEMSKKKKCGKYLISGFGVGLSYASGVLEWS